MFALSVLDRRGTFIAFFFLFVCFFGLFPQDNSKWRRHYLSSLYEYMQACNKELAFLGEEQDKIRSQDWSDHMIDPPDVRRQYEVRTIESEQWNMQILFNNCSSRMVQYVCSVTISKSTLI